MGLSRSVVLISGTGSNLQTILDGAGDQLPLKIFSSRADAAGISKAKRMGIAVSLLPNPIDWRSLHQELLDLRISRIFLLGFMKLVPAEFVELWKNQILNLHPSLLPAYPGLKAFEKAWEEGAELGASVHFVTAEMDAGEVILQRQFPRTQDAVWDRLVLSFTEQRLVREAFDYVRL